VPGPQLPAGSGCYTTSFNPGRCDARGTCQPLPPPITGSIAPAYYLVTILYAPPGTKSKASYFAGSSAGATTSTADLFGIGTKVGITGNVIATTDYQFTQQSSESFQATKTDKTELDTNSVADPIRHGQDAFYLWINPVINYTQGAIPGHAHQHIIRHRGRRDNNGGAVHRGRIDPQGAYSRVSVAIPSLGYRPDPNRFIKITSLQLDGPDNPGDNIPGQGTSVDDSHVNCQAETISQTIGADFGGAVGVDFFGQGEKATTVHSLSWKNTNSAGNCNGSSQTATVDLSTTTVGYHDVIDVYEDSLYHSFAYVSETQGVGLKLASAGVTGISKIARASRSRTNSSPLNSPMEAPESCFRMRRAPTGFSGSPRGP
jgi:hypothetical protein